MQVVFEFTQQEGLLVGFWCPAFVGSNLNVPGFHFHFLSTDKQRGGHVLQMEMQAGATAYLQEVGCAARLGCFCRVVGGWQSGVQFQLGQLGGILLAVPLTAGS